MATRSLSPFGELLRKYRAAAGFTQEELAERVGMSARGISDLERGIHRTPYRRTVELLAEALHLTPEDHHAFVQTARATGRSLASQSVATANVHGPLPPLAGRRSELALLHDLLSGSGSSVVLLVGEPGMGKTRLLYEATTYARAAGWSVLCGSCSRRGGQLLYAPLLEALEGWMRARSQEDLRAELEGCAWLVRLLPELAEQGLLPFPAVQVSPEQERRLFPFSNDIVHRFVDVGEGTPKHAQEQFHSLATGRHLWRKTVPLVQYLLDHAEVQGFVLFS